MKNAFWTCLVVMLLALVGCGGGGGGTVANPFQGTYVSNFTRGSADTVLMLTVKSDGAAYVVISSASDILYSGNGNVTTTGQFNIPVAGSGDEFTVEGTALGTDTLSVQFVGGLNNGGVVVARTGASGTPLAGTYSFDYTGDVVGSGSLTVTNSGDITGTFVGQPVTGTVTPTGMVTLNQNGSTEPFANFHGKLFLTPSGGAAGVGDYDAHDGGTFIGTWTATLQF